MKRIFVVFLCICALLVTACSSEKDQTFRVVVTAEPPVMRWDYKQIERILLDLKTEA